MTPEGTPPYPYGMAQNALGKGKRDSTGRTPIRPIRMPDPLWERIGARAKTEHVSSAKCVRDAAVMRLNKEARKA